MTRREAPWEALGVDVLVCVSLFRYVRFICVLETLESIDVDLDPIARRQSLADA